MIVFNNLLLLQLLHSALFLVLSLHTNIVVSGNVREEGPIGKFTQCTSRTLRSNDGGTTYYTANDVNIDTNGTDDDNRIDGDFDDMANNNFGLSSHPYCPEGFYCDLVQKADYNGDDSILGLCRPCSGSSESCFDGRFESTSSATETASVEECQEQCGIEKNFCSSSRDCSNGLFCHLQSDGEGFCHGCPHHPYECKEIMVRDENLTSQGIDSCIFNCPLQCRVEGFLKTTDSSTGTSSEIVDVNGIYNSIQVSATGPIVDCGLGLKTCEGAEGAVCFIERGKAPFFNKTRNCKDGGGVAAVLYNVAADCKNIDATFFDAEVFIPAITLTHIDARNILEEARVISINSPESPMYATVDVGGHDIDPGRCVLGCMVGHECEGTNLTCDFENGDYGDCEATEQRQICNNAATIFNDFLPCLKDNEYCDFSLGKKGFCSQCPDSPVKCFYSGLDGLGANECSTQCDDGKTDTELKNFDCKVCPVLNFTFDDVTEGFSSTKEEIENPCSFCAEKNGTQSTTCSDVDRWDMEYPKRTLRLFGTRDIECWAVADFYRSLNINADSPYCESARRFNYVCGCSDSVGYAGADSKAKRSALVWMPRIGAILSILGSIGMIISVLNDKERRKKVIGELIIALSCFDIIGSLGYAFASLPIPKEDYILGAKGNTASCKAQGFFIQLGTTSLYINVSIAFYYLLIIQFSWRERRLRKSRVYYLLYAVPITIGAIFAFAAIPYYENAIMWCNNSQKYWSEVPVGVAILIATYLMLSLCWFVYKSERASARFSARASSASFTRASLSKQFFNQSMVYLAAFYLTWPVYLALQIMIANGNAFSSYGFYLFAGTAVTLQGFWNFVFHSGLKLEKVKNGFSSAFMSARASFTRKGQSQSQSQNQLSKANTDDPPRRNSTRSQRRRSGEISAVTDPSKNFVEE